MALFFRNSSNSWLLNSLHSDAHSENITPGINLYLDVPVRRGFLTAFGSLRAQRQHHPTQITSVGFRALSSGGAGCGSSFALPSASVQLVRSQAPSRGLAEAPGNGSAEFQMSTAIFHSPPPLRYKWKSLTRFSAGVPSGASTI